MFRLVLIPACLAAVGLIACEQPVQPPPAERGSADPLAGPPLQAQPVPAEQIRLSSPIADPAAAASAAAAALHAITHPRKTP